MTTQLNIEFVQGDDKIIRVAVVALNGTPLTLAGMQSARYRVSKTQSSSAPPKISKALGTGIVVTDAAGGILEIALASMDTATLKGEHFHELEVVDAAGKVITVFQGTLSLLMGLIPNP